MSFLTSSLTMFLTLLCAHFWTTFRPISLICLLLGRLSTQVKEDLVQFLGINLKSP